MLIDEPDGQMDDRTKGGRVSPPEGGVPDTGLDDLEINPFTLSWRKKESA